MGETDGNGETGKTGEPENRKDGETGRPRFFAPGGRATEPEPAGEDAFPSFFSSGVCGKDENEEGGWVCPLVPLPVASLHLPSHPFFSPEGPKNEKKKGTGEAGSGKRNRRRERTRSK
ncbi:hypothetical protein AKJ57_02730 [candidate division MSBL1 archaeon SCGC-AAA259A05]|uniref:Uncharacterized protein n=1 Tax=candidate division MSBL1 archaeon SCGC-AAA259A05 TaxID=1698259 RepID=A0A133UA59_9EURY|nr:hypothetical protein AKJ57_02730 [candidate division MSBL1 archaeon SCGC-AAA259A05]